MQHAMTTSAVGGRSWLSSSILVAGAILLAACQDPMSTGPGGLEGAPVFPDTQAGAPYPQSRMQAIAREAGDVVPGRATLEWNRVAREKVVAYATGPAPAMRVFALVSMAQHNAAESAARQRGGAVLPSQSAAIAGASAVVLTYLYPNDSSYFEAKVDEQEEASAHAIANPNENFAAGEQVGRAVAREIVAQAKVDGFFKPFTGTVPVCAGCWLPIPTPPAFATLGQARTFFLTSGSQFRPAPPPAFGSPAFNAGLAEVRQYSDNRTAEQDSIAKFWSLQNGTVTPLGYWNVVADELIARHNMSDRRAAHVFALLNLAGYDALVASHDAKYTYWLIRPTQVDPQIQLAIGLPSFPSYPSNHAAISSAAATVLGAIFPEKRKPLRAAAEEAGISRIYGGIHYRFDSDVGLDMGEKIGYYVIQQDRTGRGPLAR